MDQLTMLWEYQQEDMKAERLANEIKRSPLRQKLEQDRNLYMEKQKQHKQIEEQVAVMADRKDAIRDAIVRCEEQLKGLLERFEAAPPADLEGVRALMADYRALSATLGSEVRVIGVSEEFTGRAIELDESGALVVQLPGGERRTVLAGDVSVRGLMGYVD